MYLFLFMGRHHALLGDADLMQKLNSSTGNLSGEPSNPSNSKPIYGPLTWTPSPRGKTKFPDRRLGFHPQPQQSQNQVSGGSRLAVAQQHHLHKKSEGMGRRQPPNRGRSGGREPP